MQNVGSNAKKEHNRRKPNLIKLIERKNTNWFDRLTETFGWIQIMLSPTLIGLTLGGLFYLYSPNSVGVHIGITIASTGLVIGIIWATNVKKKNGAIWFVSRIMATPELDTKDDLTEKKKKEVIKH